MKKIVVVFLLLCCRVNGQTNQLSGQVLNPTFVVHFDYKSYRLSNETKRQLDSLVYLAKNATFNIQKIEIAGYTDSIASNAYNDVLSLKRANAVGDYFKEHGVADSLIKTITGFGKRRPINDNSDSLQRLANRRVEIEFQIAIPAAKSGPADSLRVTTPNPLPDSSKLPTLDIMHMQVNDIIELKDINFYPNRHVILKATKKNLQVLLNTMKQYKTLKIEIRGHVCCLPDYEGDAEDEDSGMQDLSLERAKAIYDYLVENGIAPDRMTYVGLGGKFPKVREITEADKTQNRRVEIRIVSK